MGVVEFSEFLNFFNIYFFADNSWFDESFPVLPHDHFVSPSCDLLMCPLPFNGPNHFDIYSMGNLDS